jgi:hypothetical protein
MMTVIAKDLGPEHVGAELAYGPDGMFRGVILDVHHLTDDWLKRRHGSGEIVKMFTPSRVMVLTEDGRAVTLAYEAPVHIEEAP